MHPSAGRTEAEIVGDMPSDRDLILRFNGRNDRRAFEELVHRWDGRVIAFLVKASGNPEVAKDLRQEVFVRLYRYGRTYDPRFSFPTWLFRIATNVLKSWGARRNRWDRVQSSLDGETEFPDPVDSSPNPRESAALGEMEDRVGAAIGELSVEDRELLLLHLDLDFSYREIGEIQDTPETTVKSRFYKVLQRLRQELKQLEWDERTL